MRVMPRESVHALLDAMRQTHRPKLLLRTARLGLPDYDRERDLKRVLRLPAPPPPSPATMAALLDLEAAHEARRTRPPAEIGDPWRAARHIEVLVALMAEARLLDALLPPWPRPVLTRTVH
jgi:hypothetical protein